MDDISANWVEKFKKFEEYFKEDDIYGTVEAHRPKPKNLNNQTFGYEGSFRQLNVD